jgi:hypothetical protein
MALPKWAVDNRTAVLDETTPYRDMSDAERLEILRKVVRVGARQLAEHPDRERLATWHDPLPRSSIEALERLRREYRQHGRAA